MNTFILPRLAVPDAGLQAVPRTEDGPVGVRVAEVGASGGDIWASMKAGAA